MILQLAQRSGSNEDAARQQIMNMIGGIPLDRPGRPEEQTRWTMASSQPSRPSKMDAMLPKTSSMRRNTRLKGDHLKR